MDGDVVALPPRFAVKAEPEKVHFARFANAILLLVNLEPHALFQEPTEVSRPAESHRQALAEPDVRLSPHPPPIVQPYPCSSRQCTNSDGCRRAMRASHCCVRRRWRRRDLNFR